MAGKEVWFRSSSGHEIACNEGSVAYGLMDRDGSFTRIPGPGEERFEPDPHAVPAPPDFAAMKRAQLLEYAAGKGIEVNPKLKNADIIAVIEAAEAAAETTEE